MRPQPLHINDLLDSKIYMDNYYIFYHIFFETNWFEIVREQLTRLHSSGLLKKSVLKIGVVFGYNIDKEKNLEILYKLLSEYYNFEILYVEPNGCCGESSTLKKLYDFCENDTNSFKILYIHTKGITQHNTVREIPVSEWRKMMEYFLIDKWKESVQKLDEGYDCCGINYQNHAANIKNTSKLIKIFNGNFFWVNSNYVKTLDETILFEHRYSAENWILSNPDHNCFSFLNVPPSYDLYYNIFEGYEND